MSAGSSATELIFFITSVIIAMSVVGALFMNVESITGASTISSKTLTEQLKTDITIINDPRIIYYSGGNYSFYVKNTGTQELVTDYVTVLLDGKMIPETDLNKTVDGSQTWKTGDVLIIKAKVTLSTGDHNLRIITQNGIEDTFPFTI
ncbi:MAG: flagellar protein G [Candidatus Methanoperedens sp.]|nr:flagellar protein G [Candidatus Methanoperedens sp.]